MLVSDFDFTLPKELIATSPANPRDSAKLLDVQENSFCDRIVKDLADILNPGDLLIFNDTKVIAARIYGKCQGKEAKIEATLHKQISDGVWKAFVRPAKKLNVGDIFCIAQNFSAKVLEKNEGELTLSFCTKGDEFYTKLDKYGQPPLPPYISRENGATKEDIKNYQTIYAKNEGAVAAPTAGLHFTEEVFKKLEEKNIKKAFVTLHVGAGTFLPIKAEDTKDHKMHSEYCVIKKDVADLINETKKSGRNIVAVGTTSLRVLESAANEDGTINEFASETDIFITPGYKFKIVDNLLTNFHLPKSTLFMLICAFAGYERMKQAYEYAIEQKYRFYSYGDACFLRLNKS